MFRTIFYVKNVPMVERVLGVGLAAGTLFLFFQPTSGLSFRALAAIGLFSALFAVVTGFVGWCPACAMAGRKLKSGQPK